MIFKKHIPRDIRGVQDCIFYRIGEKLFLKNIYPEISGVYKTGYFTELGGNDF